MGYWIKAVGTSAWQMPNHWEDVRNGLFRNAVTFARKPSVEEDDELVLYATGTGRLFATAVCDKRAISAPQRSGVRVGLAGGRKNPRRGAVHPPGAEDRRDERR